MLSAVSQDVLLSLLPTTPYDNLQALLHARTMPPATKACAYAHLDSVGTRVRYVSGVCIMYGTLHSVYALSSFLALHPSPQLLVLPVETAIAIVGEHATLPLTCATALHLCLETTA